MAFIVPTVTLCFCLVRGETDSSSPCEGAELRMLIGETDGLDELTLAGQRG